MVARGPRQLGREAKCDPRLAAAGGLTGQAKPLEGCPIRRTDALSLAIGESWLAFSPGPFRGLGYSLQRAHSGCGSDP